MFNSNIIVSGHLNMPRFMCDILGNKTSIKDLILINGLMEFQKKNSVMVDDTAFKI